MFCWGFTNPFRLSQTHRNFYYNINAVTYILIQELFIKYFHTKTVQKLIILSAFTQYVEHCTFLYRYFCDETNCFAYTFLLFHPVHSISQQLSNNCWKRERIAVYCAFRGWGGWTNLVPCSCSLEFSKNSSGLCW